MSQLTRDHYLASSPNAHPGPPRYGVSSIGDTDSIALLAISGVLPNECVDQCSVSGVARLESNLSGMRHSSNYFQGTNELQEVPQASGCMGLVSTPNNHHRHISTHIEGPTELLHTSCSEPTIGIRGRVSHPSLLTQGVGENDALAYISRRTPLAELRAVKKGAGRVLQLRYSTNPANLSFHDECS